MEMGWENSQFLATVSLYLGKVQEMAVVTLIRSHVLFQTVLLQMTLGDLNGDFNTKKSFHNIISKTIACIVHYSVKRDLKLCLSEGLCCHSSPEV